MQLEDATGKPILNPRSIDATSLEQIDLDWREDLHRHRQWLRYVSDSDKRPTGKASGRDSTSLE